MRFLPDTKLRRRAALGLACILPAQGRATAGRQGAHRTGLRPRLAQNSPTPALPTPRLRARAALGLACILPAQGRATAGRQDAFRTEWGAFAERYMARGGQRQGCEPPFRWAGQGA